jgi:anti-sigma regulatory factor (Ser/Thr protein kinase)
MSYQRSCRQIHRKLARAPGAAAIARHELDRFGGELDTIDLEISALLLSELVTNSIQHAGPDAGAHMQIDLTMTRDRLRVEVRDGGRGFVPTPRLYGPSETGHWGIELLGRLADRWQVVSANGNAETLVWFELDRGSARAREEQTV